MANKTNSVKEITSKISKGDIEFDSEKFGKVTISTEKSPDINKMKIVTIKTSKNISDADREELESYIIDKGYYIDASKDTGKKKIVFIINRPSTLENVFIATDDILEYIS